MNQFEHVGVSTLTDAFSHMVHDWDTRIIAGGVDLIHEMKQGITQPKRLIDIKGIAELRGVSQHEGVIRIGALTTLDELEKDRLINDTLPVLHEAAYEAASPQLWNMGTVAGNVCQRPRCWYYRNPEFPCLRKGGKNCFAAGGENAYHAVVGGGPCHIVCPSDLALALMALHVRIEIASPAGTREIPLDDFFVDPTTDPHRENILQPDEIVTAFFCDSPKGNTTQKFIKIRERKTWDFALASIAVMMRVDAGVIVDIGIAYGGVAPNPWRAATVEDALRGARPEEIDIEQAADLGVEETKPLRDNRYKVDLMRVLMRRGITACLGAYLLLNKIIER